MVIKKGDKFKIIEEELVRMIPIWFFSMVLGSFLLVFIIRDEKLFSYIIPVFFLIPIILFIIFTTIRLKKYKNIKYKRMPLNLKSSFKYLIISYIIISVVLILIRYIIWRENIFNLKNLIINFIMIIIFYIIYDSQKKKNEN